MGRVFTIAEGLENLGALRSGGQGSVYKGKRIGEIITAVKLLPTPVHAEDENDKNFISFQNEVRKLKKVNEKANPNVVKILNSGITESGGLPFIEMEFIEGPDLEELLKAPHEPVFLLSEVIKVACHLSNALAHCHQVAVMHGDIKSNNIKFNIHTGNYMLLDFGLAIMSDEQRRTSLRHAGAIEFMAPEQNRGELYFQTDVYSFGIVLFELLTGTVPFPLADNGETSRNNVMLSHMEAPVPDLLELRKRNIPLGWSDEKKQREVSVPDWLISLVNKCLEKNSESRYSDGIALHEAVLRHSYNSTVAEKEAGELTKLRAENEQLRALLSPSRKDSSPGAIVLNNDEQAGIGKFGMFKKRLLGLNPIAQVLIGILVLFVLVSGFATVGRRGAESALIDTAVLNAENRSLRDSIALLKAKRADDSLKAELAIAEARQEEARKFEAQFAEEEKKDQEELKSKKKGKLKKWFQVHF